MSEEHRHLSREEVAQLEIGVTDIGRRNARVLTACILFCLFFIPIVQPVYDWIQSRREGAAYSLPQSLDVLKFGKYAMNAFQEAGPGAWNRIKAANATLLEQIHGYEQRLEEESILTQTLLGPTQLFLARYFGLGNEEAYIGRDGWLFYRPGVDYCTGPGFLDSRQLERRSMEGNEWTARPQPNPLKAILDFHQQLEARGITLIIMPTTVKPSLYWRHFTPGESHWNGPIQNRSYDEFLQSLEEAGVAVFDPTPILSRAQLGGRQVFFKTDTHWRPWAMEMIAAELAAFIRQTAPGLEGAARWHRTEQAVSSFGDIAAMLSLPEGQEYIPRETASVHPVQAKDGSPWMPDQQAQILLLGDSFSNIFSNAQMGWGGHGGLPEQLAYALQRPVDRIVRNDSGAYATRQMLASEMRRGRDRLEGKKVVVWQFAARELSVGDWKLIPVLTGEKEVPAGDAADFIALEPGDRMVVEGRILAASPVPVPGSVPYKDHIRSLHLSDIRNLDGAGPAGRQALVYVWSMRDNQWTEAAQWDAGDRVQLALSSWYAREDELGSINRSEIDDFELQLQDPCWGEPSVSP